MVDSTEPEEAECRICRGNAEPSRPLLYPCKCSGSIKYTHEDCLVQWLQQSRTEECELCHHNFRFEPMYRPNTPQSLPFAELLAGIFTRARAGTRAASRISLVGLIWLFMLPLMTCWTWHAVFAGSVNQLPLMLLKRGPFGIFQDVFQGHVLSLVIIFIFFGVSSLREHIQNPNDGAAQVANGNEAEEDGMPLRDEDRPATGANSQDGPAQGMASSEELDEVEGERTSNSGGLEASEVDTAGSSRIGDPVVVKGEVTVGSVADDGSHNRSGIPGEAEDSRVGSAANPSTNEQQLVNNNESTTNSGASEETSNAPELSDGAENREQVDEAGTPRNEPPGTPFNDDIDVWRQGRRNRGALIVADAEGNIIGNENRERNGDGAPLFGLFDLDPEDVPLEEVVGLKGPIRNLFENSGTVLFSNIIFLCVFVLLPLVIGRMFLRVVSFGAIPLHLPSLSEGMESATSLLQGSTMRELMAIIESRSVRLEGPKMDFSRVPSANISDTGLIKISSVNSSDVSATVGQQYPAIGNFLTVFLGYGVISLACACYVILSSLLKSRYPRLDSPTSRYMFRFVRCVATFLKVVLLIVFEFGLFPLGCGWWLDMCTLAFVGGTYESRVQSLRSAPWISTFSHWFLGLVYMINVSLFVTILRDLIQPSLLWFLRNPDDPDFQPFRELIHKPLSRHARRMALSVLIYGPLIFLFVFVPCQLCVALLPDFVPFNVHFSDPLTELAADLLLLHACIPLTSVIQRANPRKVAMHMLKLWIRHVSRALGIYHLVALEDETTADDARAPIEEEAAELKYVRFRGAVMITLAWISLISVEMLIVTLPTVCGRLTFEAFGFTSSHDICTFAIGAYELVFLAEAILHAIAFVRNHELLSALRVIRRCMCAVMKIAVFLALWLGLLPLMTGLVIEVVVIVPTRVAVDESVHWYLYQDWSLGLLIMKLGMRLLIANERTLRARWNAIRAGGLRALDNEFVEIMRTFVVPLLCIMGSFLSFPLIITRSILPRLGINEEWLQIADRYTYLATALTAFQLLVCVLGKKALTSLHDKIRDDKYLVGRRLYNFGATQHRELRNEQTRVLASSDSG